MAPKYTQDEIAEYRMLQQSPIYFVQKTWGMTPQPAKAEYQNRLTEIVALEGDDWEERKHEIEASWFGTFDERADEWHWPTFERGKHITWQQYIILLSMEKALKHKAAKSISIASGRGIGKSASLSWILLWFLFSYPDCKIPCTAPGYQQMYDVLWTEIAIWINRMPPKLKEMYEWESSHVRMKESPYTWFARAKTASKENPEALSGVHADFVLALVDEASGVPDEIYEAAQGIFSSHNAFLIMISNPTRVEGYFFRSQDPNAAASMFQVLSFSSKESPVVNKELVLRYSDEGKDSDKYRINVLGVFPSKIDMDGGGYLQLVSEHLIKMERPQQLGFRNAVLGVDPAGEGDNQTAYCVRDNFFGEIVGIEDDASTKSIARNILTIADKFRIDERNVVIDAFGIGHDIGREIALAVRWNVYTVNVAEHPDDDTDREMFLNKKSMMFWRMKRWLENGGTLVENKKLKEQILSIRYRRTTQGKIQIMSKREMRGLGIPSPDLADALAMTFLRTPNSTNTEIKQKQALEAVPFNKWGV